MRRKQFALIAWLIVIFVLSSQPATSSSSMSSPFAESLRNILPSFSITALTFLVRKSAHIFLYTTLGVLTYSVAIENKLSNRLRAMYSIGFITFCAIIDELHQLMVPGRSGELRDILIDVAAGALGIAILFLHVLPRLIDKSEH